jgi:hypothetical protein
LECPKEERDKHPWKIVYYTYLDAATDWANSQVAVSDAGSKKINNNKIKKSNFF